MHSEKMMDHLDKIFAAAVARVDPFNMLLERIKIDDDKMVISLDDGDLIFDLSGFSRLVVIGAGKATAKMALAIESIFKDRISEGIISVKTGHTEPLKIIRIIEAGHPIPDENSETAAKNIIDICEKCDEHTIVINLISGGGSSLLTYPFQISVKDKTDLPQITFDDIQETTRILLGCGATIHEVNCIRKHISGIKGGRLVNFLFPSTVVNLILSDVVGDRLDSIASGLTAPDETTYSDASAIIKKYDLRESLPQSVVRLIEEGVTGNVPETPKEGDPIFEKVHNVLIGSNYSALMAAKSKAEEFGYNAVVLSTQITGEAREVAKLFYGIGKDVLTHRLFSDIPACIIAGGETTVTMKGKGKGGRNQEMALSFLSEIESDKMGASGIVFLSGATDGNDGPTDAAGAVASLQVLESGNAESLDIQAYLKNNDAYNYFDQINYLIKTGPTNTNVCDVQVMIVS